MTSVRDDYLTDPTGSRRFWPVRTGKIDLEGLSVVRDQLWAEAVHAYRNGEIWYLNEEIEGQARLEQSERGHDDPWVDNVLKFAEGKEFVSAKMVLVEGLHITSDRCDNRSARRVGDILRSLGWRADGQFTSGTYKGNKRFVRPRNAQRNQ